MNRATRRARMTLVALVLSALAAACVVDTPGIETTGPAPAPATPTIEPTVATPQFQPTADVEPTATAEPTPAPTPTTAEPTATPVPEGPPPLPTAAPDSDFEPTPVEAGLVVVPVRGARFRLAETRPILQLGGHTLIYVDEERTAEVDIFVPAAAADGNELTTYQAVISYLETNVVFSGLAELSPVSIAGNPTRVYEGIADSAERAFITDLTALDNTQFGWFPPARMRLWVIDHPAGPVVVSAESLENPGRYSDAVRLATEILSTVDFG